MMFAETPLPGVFEIAPEPHRDARGSFARLYCPEAFAEAGIAFTSTQINLSTNPHKHTLRGLHFQPEPFAEAKVVRAMRGRAFDVAVDLRPGPTQGRWHAVTLDALTMNAVFLPEGVAHGFLTLEEDTDLMYQMGRPFEAGHASGIAWNDPDLAIKWPFPPSVISDADVGWPSLAEMLDG